MEELQMKSGRHALAWQLLPPCGAAARVLENAVHVSQILVLGKYLLSLLTHTADKALSTV